TDLAVPHPPGFTSPSMQRFADIHVAQELFATDIPEPSEESGIAKIGNQLLCGLSACPLSRLKFFQFTLSLFARLSIGPLAILRSNSLSLASLIRIHHILDSASVGRTGV